MCVHVCDCVCVCVSACECVRACRYVSMHTSNKLRVREHICACASVIQHEEENVGAREKHGVAGSL